MFSKPLSPFQEPKTNKSVFQSEPEPLSCFELNCKFLERHKKPPSLTTRESKRILSTRPRKWQAKVQPSKTEKRQRRKCQGSMVTIQKKNYLNYITSDSFVLFGWNILYNPQINCLKSRVRL